VRDALDRLGARDREVLLLAEWEGLSAAEIASVLGCLTVTARGRLHRARARFRAVYEELDGAGGRPAPVATGRTATQASEGGP
jgi:RNA polymerase sigma-70 factor (ECF subfamily)